MSDVLIVDASAQSCDELMAHLRRLGQAGSTACTLREAFAHLESSPAGLVLLSSQMPDGDSLEMIPRLKQSSASPEVIVYSENPDPDEAELAVKNGAWEYTVKPNEAGALAVILERFGNYGHRAQETTESNDLDHGRFDGIVGNSPELRASLKIVARAANSDANVLIKGETGTGKELIAWAIHNNSPRSTGNFVVVDCAALPETLVESTLLGHAKGAFTGADRHQSGLVKQADGGTLFLDEVGELPLSAQKSFLRVLEERRFRSVGGTEEIRSDFRLISASNQDLDDMVRKSTFREDLLFRLRSFTIDVPPLRKRPDDIRSIVAFHMPKICARLGIDIKEIAPEYYDALMKYQWPGNVRELVNSLERSLVAARTEPVLLPQHMATYLRIRLARAFAESHRTSTKTVADSRVAHDVHMPPLQTARELAVDQAEKAYLEKLLAATGGNIVSACRVSKLSRSRLYFLLKKHRINVHR